MTVRGEEHFWSADWTHYGGKTVEVNDMVYLPLAVGEAQLVRLFVKGIPREGEDLFELTTSVGPSVYVRAAQLRFTRKCSATMQLTGTPNEIARLRKLLDQDYVGVEWAD